MIHHAHLQAQFPNVKPENVPGLGWAVVGRSKDRPGSFAVVLLPEHGKGFTSREKARAAVKEIKAC